MILPVDIQATMDHVAQTLPSASNLSIQVNTSFGDKRIVSLPKVLRALRYLKLNNELYHDIEINEQFKFRLNEDVFFEKPV